MYESIDWVPDRGQVALCAVFRVRGQHRDAGGGLWCGIPSLPAQTKEAIADTSIGKYMYSIFELFFANG